MQTRAINDIVSDAINAASSGVAILRAGRLAAAGAVLGLALTGGQALAEDGREYAIPTEKLNCLVDNQQKYLDLPRAIIMFSPGSCPAVGHEEVAGLALNSGASAGTVKRLMMTKPDFSCLVEKIDAYLKTDGESSARDIDQVAFVLDCP